jgi:hypothetical protein
MATIALDPKSLSVWEANMKELRRCQPDLAAALEKWTDLYGHAFEHDEMVTPAGTWVSGLTPEPFFQPAEIPEQPWRKGEEKEVSLIFVYGAGIAPWLFRMVRALPRGTLSVVVLEPNLSLVAYLLHTTNIYLAAPDGCRISFAAELREAAVEEALLVNVMPLGTYIATQARVWEHPGEFEAFAPEVKRLQQLLHERIITKLQELGNSAEDTLLGFRQVALSSPWIVFLPSIETILQVYRGRPFIWVASGPSLEKNVRLLRDNADRAVIVCADTAASKLLGLGIVPHIVVALERGMPVYQYLEKTWTRYPEEAKKILLISQAVCVPEVAGKWPGPKLVLGKLEIPVDNWLIGGVLKGDLIYSGLCVAHMGIWAAAVMGASSLALIGQDLAFGPERQTHAGETVNARTAELEQAGTGRILKRDFIVPGALGGTVVTHEMWFLYLRVIERFLPMLGIPVFDCTEGGALIQGTTVLPLKEWLAANVEGIEPFERTPAELVDNAAKKPEERADAVKRTLENTAKGMRFIQTTRQKLEEAAAQIERVSAPALSPRQRRDIALEMSVILDELHRSNPVLEFIGQSQVTLNAASISSTRYLDDVFAVAEWKRIHEEIVKGHRTALDFMETWLQYTAVAVRKIHERWDEGYSTENLPFYPVGSVRDLNPLEKDLMAFEAMEQMRKLTNAETGEEILNAHVLLDNLIARTDHKWWVFWDDRIDWKLALALEQEGRNAEAVHYISRMEHSSMGIYGLPHEAGLAFLKDGARIISSNDMCYNPNFDLARLYAQNAIDLEPEDGEARQVLRDVSASALRYYSDVLASSSFEPGKATLQSISAEWAMERAKAESALADEDLDVAFEIVWGIIKKFIFVIRDGTSDYLGWLTDHISRFESAGRLSERAANVRREVFAWMPLFKELGMKIAPEFAHIAEEPAKLEKRPLAEQGIEV